MEFPFHERLYLFESIHNVFRNNVLWFGKGFETLDF